MHSDLPSHLLRKKPATSSPASVLKNKPQRGPRNSKTMSRKKRGRIYIQV